MNHPRPYDSKLAPFFTPGVWPDNWEGNARGIQVTRKDWPFVLLICMIEPSRGAFKWQVVMNTTVHGNCDSEKEALALTKHIAPWAFPSNQWVQPQLAGLA